MMIHPSFIALQVLAIVLPGSSGCVPDVQDFYRVLHAIEYFVGIASDKYDPDIGIVSRITAKRMFF